MPFPKGRRLPTGRPMRRPRQGQAEKAPDPETDGDEITSGRDEEEIYESLPPNPTALQIWRLAKSLNRPTQPRKHYGQITSKHLEVLRVLLWTFHNGQMPSFETIAKELRNVATDETLMKH